MPDLITDISLADFPSVVRELGLKKYAASQIISWLYKECVSSFDEMTNLSKDARTRLKQKYELAALSVDKVLKASDGTQKFLCRAVDGGAVECVYIPAEDGRNTVCLSTQIGCAMGCAFCRTAGMGFIRNLTQGEIVGQLILMTQAVDKPITNIVLMGMGEPLANLDAVSGAVEIFLDARAFGLSRRRVTLSTSGVIPALKKFSEKFDIKIAISLNATTDEVRGRLMPVGLKFPLSEIMEFCREYSNRSRYKITFEYVLIDGVNDSMDDAKRLVRLLKGVKGKINLIPLNPFEGSGFKGPKKGVMEMWRDYLAEHNIQANIRVSRGAEILAACGQLASIGD